MPGIVNGAIDFHKYGNGLSGARVSPQGALATVGSADFTIDAWVRSPAAAADRPHYIVNRFDPATNKGYALYVTSPGAPGNDRLVFKWGDGGSEFGTVPVPLTDGQWHHVAVTFARNVGGNALEIRLYVDGVQRGLVQLNPVGGVGSLVNFLTLEIGWQPSTIDEPITIDELEIFNRALPLSEIGSIYNAGSAGKCKPDFGDAPDSYGTTLVANGARHLATSNGPRLGTLIDGEANGVPSVGADGDDLSGVDDEDGVTITGLNAGGVATAHVVLSGPTSAKLDAWVDFNKNGVFGDVANEHIFSSSTIVNGNNALTFSVLGFVVTTGALYARFRVSTLGGLGPTGLAVDGEVEDYQLGTCAPTFCPD